MKELNKEDNSALLFEVRANDVFRFVSYESDEKFKVDMKINNEDYMTKRERKKFFKLLHKASTISRSAYIRYAEELIADVENRKEEG